MKKQALPLELGQTLISRNFADTIKEPHAEANKALTFHRLGHWGKVKDPKVNDQAIEDEQNGLGSQRIFSVYTSMCGHDFWVITEHDRSATTVMLPEDY